MLTVSQRLLIIAISIAIPGVVAALFYISIDGYDLTFLPPFYAGINALTAMTLIAAVVAIRRGRRILHEQLMKASIILSGIFLVCYVLYHITTDPTRFGDTDHNGVLSAAEEAAAGPARMVYFLILASHILLSLLVIPMVLTSYAYGRAGLYEKHRRISRFTFPVWLYIAITGVIVYLMISPYYVS